MKTSRLISLAAVCSVVVGLSTFSSTQPGLAQESQSPAKAKMSEKVELLFVQNSMSGTFDGNTLTLEGVGPTVYFSDRPERVAGQVRTAEFIGHWDKGSDNFAADPPNATLSVFGESKVDSAVVELRNPRLTGNSLSYQVKVLKGSLPKSFKESSLFIDIFGRWRMYAAGAAAGAAAAGAGAYYYHPAPVYVTPPPIYVAPRPVYVYP